MSSTSGWCGMRGTGDWTNDERPKNFRETILYFAPNGQVPLTAITSKGRSRRVDDPEFSWYSKAMSDQGGTVAGVYSDVALTVPLTGVALTAGQGIYAQMAEAITNSFRIGHGALLIDTDIPTRRVLGKVVEVHKAGANSYVRISVLRAVTDIAVIGNVDAICVCGDMNAEGAAIPEAISYDPSKYSNYTQIIRTPLDITRTQQRTRMRTGDKYNDLKIDALLYHGLAIESTAIDGEATEGVGSNGKPERTTRGYISFMSQYEPTHVRRYAADVPALTWRLGGEDWMDETLELAFRYGRTSKLALAGSGAILGLMKLMKQAGTFNFTPETGAYGVKVNRWVTPFGELLIKHAPLLTHRPWYRNSILVLEPENVTMAIVDDTFFKPDDSLKKGGRQGYDGTKEEYLTEFGWEWHCPQAGLVLHGVGIDP